MKEGKILLPYKIILKRLWGVSVFGKLKIRCAREIVTRNLRLGSENWNDIYMEMKSLGYITFYGRRQGIQINIPLKDLV